MANLFDHLAYPTIAYDAQSLPGLPEPALWEDGNVLSPERTLFQPGLTRREINVSGHVLYD